MTEPYTYTDADNCQLLVLADTRAPKIQVQTSELGVDIPPADVPGVIRGFLAQYAAAQGHDAADPLAHIRRDIDLAQEGYRPGSGMLTIQAGERIHAAIERVTREHGPLLYALAAAYLGDDAPIWAELGRVQRERDAARAANEQACNRAQYACDAVDKATETVQRLSGELATARAENERLHAELAEMSQTLGENVGQALIDKTMLKALNVVDGQAHLDIEPARELLLTWCASVRAMLDHHGAENYTETEITAPLDAVSMDIQDGQHNTDSYTLTLQRRHRPTPHEMRERADRERDKARADATGLRELLDTAEAAAQDHKRHVADLTRCYTITRRAVAEWIYDVNDGGGRDASDLMWALEQAGVPLTVELATAEEKREEERAEAARETCHAEWIADAHAYSPCSCSQCTAGAREARAVDTGTYDNPDDTTELPAGHRVTAAWLDAAREAREHPTA